MHTLAVDLAILCLLRVDLRWIGIVVARLVFASGEVDVVVILDLGIQLQIGSHESHRVAASADIARVGIAAVHQAGVVQAALTRLENARHREFLASLHGINLQVKNILRRVDIHIVGKPFLPLGMRPGNNLHASIYQSGGIHSQPYGDDIGWSLLIIAPSDH